MKYYHAQNCNRFIVAGKHSIQFTPYEYVGTWMGVYATDKDSEITALDILVKDGKLHSINEKEYNDALKKKRMASEGYSGSMAAVTPTPGTAPSVAPTVNPLPTPVPSLAANDPLKSVEDAIAVVPVQPKPASGPAVPN